MTQSTALRAAETYVKAGLSVVPIRTDGSKALALAAGERKTYEERLANADELVKWFAASAHGVAILGGKVSGNLCCIDFDHDAEKLFPKWCELVPQELLEVVVINQTPRPGYHVVYRVDGMNPPTCKLATKPNGMTARGPTIETTIETRGQGGYFIAPGSPLTTHNTKKAWTHIRGNRLSQIATVNASDHESMLSAARSLTYIEPPKARICDNNLSPGTDFNRRADWPSILEPHGWIVACVRGDATYWRRPGKTDTGISATTGHCKADDGQPLLHVFSSNSAPLEAEKTYDKFGAFARLNHGGDFREAAAALKLNGYGMKAEPVAKIAPITDTDLHAASVNEQRSQETSPDSDLDVLAERLRPMIAAMVGEMLKDASATLYRIVTEEKENSV